MTVRAAAVRRLGKYQIVRLIGRGGGGTVYEALHPELKKRVAIKTLHRKLAASPEFLRRFLREGEAAARIRHPHVVDITDFGVQDAVPFLVMELLEGQDLRGYLAARGRLELAEILDLLLPVIAAVGAGHDAGVVHRDLKPSNVFISTVPGAGLHAKVLDFGVSKLMAAAASDSSISDADLLIGTVSYMAPEQARGLKEIDARVDQYALALIIHECLTGRPVHQGEDQLAIIRQIVEGTISAPAVNPPPPPLFQAALMQALARDPWHRFPTVCTFGRALLPFAGDRVRTFWRCAFEPMPTQELRAVAELQSLPSTAGPTLDTSIHVERRPPTRSETPPGPGPRRSKRRSWLALLPLGAAALLAGGGVAALAHRRRRARPVPAAHSAPVPGPPATAQARPPRPDPAAPVPPAAASTEEPAALEPDPPAALPRSAPARARPEPPVPPAQTSERRYRIGANQAPIITD